MNKQQLETHNDSTSEPVSRRLWRALSLVSATVIFADKMIIDGIELNNPAPPIDLTDKVAMGTFAVGLTLGFFCSEKAGQQRGDVTSPDTSELL